MKQFLLSRIKPFPAQKYLLLAALVCEVLALLIRKEMIAADPSLVSRLTVAGAVLVLIYLIYDGIRKKAAQVRAAMGLDEEEEESAENGEGEPPLAPENENTDK